MDREREGGEDFMFFSSREGASFLRLIGLQSGGLRGPTWRRKSETELTNGQETRVRRSEEEKYRRCLKNFSLLHRRAEQ